MTAQAAGFLAAATLPARLRPPAKLEPHVQSRYDGVQRAAGCCPSPAEQGPPEHRHPHDVLAQPGVAVRREVVAVPEDVGVVPAVALQARHLVRRDAHEGAVDEEGEVGVPRRERQRRAFREGEVAADERAGVGPGEHAEVEQGDRAVAVQDVRHGVVARRELQDRRVAPALQPEARVPAVGGVRAVPADAAVDPKRVPDVHGVAAAVGRASGRGVVVWDSLRGRDAGDDDAREEEEKVERTGW